MKKIFLLFASALLSLGAMANVEFTFTRGADKAATVTAPEGLTATMATNVDWNTGGIMASRTDVLCPNRNTSQASGDNYITYTLTISGVAQEKEFAAAKFTNIAVNSGGNLQPSNDVDIRHCNFTLSANGTEVASLTDQNIWIAAGQTDRVVTLQGTSFTADAEGKLTLVLKLAKGTSNNGCFYGLTKVELVEASAEPEPEPSVEHAFSADKVYYIRPQKAGATYLTEAEGKLSMANNALTKYQFWRLIPTDESHCYYIQNVVTGNYIAACAENATNNTQATTGDTPVEYYIGITASTINEIAGCYYMASTNWPNYNDEAQGPKCLNTGGSVGGAVVTYTAGPNNSGGYKKNSYWKIVETTEEYQAPEPPAHTEQTKSLVVYFRPCGMVSNTYLTAAAINGVDPVAYTASAKPGSFYVPYSKDHGAVMPGSTFNISITLNSADDKDLKANAYFDWNADGEFEATQAITLDGTAGTASVTVPNDAVSGDTRMRIRLNSNGLDRADDDVEGFVYDIPFAVVGAERKVLVDVNSADRGTASLSAAEGNHAVGTQLTATATPKGNATFDSWREGGVVVSREKSYTFAVANRNMTLKAYFTLNTEEPEEPEPSEATPAQWDFTFTRTSTTEATASVTNGGEVVEGVTATIAIAGGEYQNVGQTESNKGILCINRNTADATAAAPNAYTLTITNNSDLAYTFDYVVVAGVALNSEGTFQTASAPRDRMFQITYGTATLAAEKVSINDPQHCNGKETFHAFATPITIPVGESYVITVNIYNDTNITGEQAKGCFYGLSKIALGNTIVSFGATGYATLYAPIALTIPVGVTAYTGTLNEDNTWLTLSDIEDGIIPKEHAVILKSESGNKFTLEAATDAGTAVANNALKGQISTVAKPAEGTVYTLQSYDGNEDGVKESVIFRKYLGEKVSGGRAYVVLPANENGTPAQSIGVRFEGSTDIEHSTLNPQPSTQIYDLFGRRVESMTKGGIYIVNGRKVIK